jgi:hypothetical protein
VTSERRRVATVVTGLSIALIVALGLRPVSGERIVAGYVLALAAVALASAIRILGARLLRDTPSAFELALRPRRNDAMRPAELVRIEREITLGTTTAGHLQNRLIPLLRDAAVARLGADVTRARLGDEAWELLRPDRPEPEDRNGPGIPLSRVRSVVTTLEQL